MIVALLTRSVGVRRSAFALFDARLTSDEAHALLSRMTAADFECGQTGADMLRARSARDFKQDEHAS